jgi:hypothetical protein
VVRSAEIFAEGNKQLRQTATSVAAAVKGSTERLAENSKDIGLCALRQGQQNSARLFAALQDMAKASDAASASQVYSSFLQEAAQIHVDQTRELGQMFSRTWGDIWTPFASALTLPTSSSEIQAA